jgi:phosphohistidine phosphatase
VPGPDKLILLRHAESPGPEAGQEDRDRRLSRRGREAAARLGQWLRDNGHAPDAILCSAAARTRETTEMLGFDAVEVAASDDLYEATGDEILAAASEGRGTLLVVGHNPGMAQAARMAAAEAPAHPDWTRYPPAAASVVDASRGLPGRVLAFVVPRDLRD